MQTKDMVPESDVGEKPQKDNVIPFAKPQAQATGGPTGGDNWLVSLEVGCIFLFRPRNQPPGVFHLQRGEVVRKYSNSTLILDDLNTEQYFIALNEEFCNVFIKEEILRDRAPE